MMNIRIEAIQYTPGGEPVLVQYSAEGDGPMARSTLFHTTQEALGDGWNDQHVLEALEAHLTAHELTAVVPMADEVRANGNPSVPTKRPEKVAP